MYSHVFPSMSGHFFADDQHGGRPLKRLRAHIWAWWAKTESLAKTIASCLGSARQQVDVCWVVVGNPYCSVDHVTSDSFSLVALDLLSGFPPSLKIYILFYFIIYIVQRISLTMVFIFE